MRNFTIFLLFILSCTITVAQENIDQTELDTLQTMQIQKIERPTDLEITALNDRYLSLKWKDNSDNETGFVIERKENNKDFSQIVNLPSNSTSFMDEEVSFGIEYIYRIYAVNDDTVSAFSEEVKAKTIFPEPEALAYEQIDDTSLLLSWQDRCDFEMGFIIERKSNTGNFEEITRVDANQESYRDENLICREIYHYRVIAYNEYNSSDPSNEIEAQINFPAPENFRARPIDDASVRFSWDDVTDYEMGFKLERRTEETDFVEIADLDANKVLYTDKNLTSEKKYFYRIKAYTNKNESDISEEIMVQTTFPPPSDLEVDIIDDISVKLYWLNRTDFTKGFIVERRCAQDTFQVIARIDGEARTYIDSSLVLGRKYFFRIKAFSDYNQSNYSNEVTAITKFPKPENLYYEKIDDQALNLFWDDNCCFEESFILERKEGSGEFQTIAELDADITSYKDTGLNYGTKYFYRIKAITSSSESPYSEEIVAVTFFPAPSYLSAIVLNDRSIKLSWRDNCDFDIGFLLERRTENEGYREIATLEATTLEYVDTNLQFGVEYSYRIKARTELNTSNFSNVVTTRTIFPGPTYLTREVIDDQSVKLYWNDNCDFEDGYIVERKKDDGEFVEHKRLPADAVSFDDNGLKYSSTYIYRICAFTIKNKSNFSNQVEVKTIFPAPTALEVNIVGDGVLGLSWEDNCSFEQGYRVERSTDGTNFSLVTNTAENIINYEDKDLDYKETYTYRVCAFSDVNRSNYTQKVSKLLIVAKPVVTQIDVIGDEKIRLAWKDNCQIEEGFIVERKTAETDFTTLGKLPPNTVSFIDEETEEHVRYYYRLFAYTSKSQSEFSRTVDAVCHFGKLRVPDEYDTIMDAIRNSQSGNTVLIRPGVYQENLKIGNRNIRVCSYYEEENDPSLIEKTIIDGQQLDKVIAIENCVNTEICGLTIRNGKSTDKRGGGVYIYNSDPVVRDLVIRNNSAEDFGGGMFMVDSNPVISNVTIMENQAIGEVNGYGGGIYISNSNPVLTRMKIIDNSASRFGAAIYAYRTDFELRNGIIARNTLLTPVENAGGAIYTQYAAPVIENVTFHANRAIKGGAIFCNNDSELKISNSIFWDNLPQAIYFHNFGDIKIRMDHSIIAGLEEGIQTNNNGTLYLQAGLLEDDPLFIDPQNNNYRLQSDSPAIDSGNSDAKFNDVDGSPNDMGAYGGPLGEW